MFYHFVDKLFSFWAIFWKLLDLSGKRMDNTDRQSWVTSSGVKPICNFGVTGGTALAFHYFEY
jgi:hypothetical protein